MASEYLVLLSFRLIRARACTASTDMTRVLSLLPHEIEGCLCDLLSSKTKPDGGPDSSTSMVQSIVVQFILFTGPHTCPILDKLSQHGNSGWSKASCDWDKIRGWIFVDSSRSWKELEWEVKGPHSLQPLKSHRSYLQSATLTGNTLHECEVDGSFTPQVLLDICMCALVSS